MAKKQEKQVKVGDAATAPVSRLVGIELNPGPRPSSASASSLASYLFNDGLAMIYSYLSTPEWNSCGRTSHHWFHVASIVSKHDISFTRIKLVPNQLEQQHELFRMQKSQSKSFSSTTLDSMVQNISRTFTRLFRSTTTTTEAKRAAAEEISSHVPFSSSWSLRHHVHSLSLLSVMDFLPHIFLCLPQLRSLELVLNTSPTRNIKNGKIVNSYPICSNNFKSIVNSGTFQFPSSLTSFKLDSSSNSTLPQTIIQMFASTFNSSSTLIELHLATLTPDLDFAPLQWRSKRSTPWPLCLSLSIIRLDPLATSGVGAIGQSTSSVNHIHTTLRLVSLNHQLA